MVREVLVLNILQREYIETTAGITGGEILEIPAHPLEIKRGLMPTVLTRRGHVMGTVTFTQAAQIKYKR